LASGVTILESGSFDEAATIGMSCPILQSGGSVFDYETIKMGN
jgi:hypothetical protein